MTTTNKDFKVKHGLDVANGGTFGGPVTVGTPTGPDHAATKDYVDAISLITGPTGPAAEFQVGATAPSSPQEGQIWFDPTTAAEYVYYDGFWVEISGPQGLQGPTGPTGATGPGIAGVTATATELNYSSGVTSAIQTQLDSKASSASPAISNATFSGATMETATYSGFGFSGFTMDVSSNHSVQILYGTASGNGTVNIRWSSGTTLNSAMAVGKSLTFTLGITNGSTPYYPNAWQIDGVSVTPKWLGGTAPTSGNASAIDLYTMTVIKTASTPAYLVLGSASKFA